MPRHLPSKHELINELCVDVTDAAQAWFNEKFDQVDDIESEELTAIERRLMLAVHRPQLGDTLAKQADALA